MGNSLPAIPSILRRRKNPPVADTDFEAEGLLEGVSGKAREARLALLRDLAEAGVPLEELRRAVAEDRLALLPVERVFEPGAERYSPREIAELTGLDLDYLIRLQQALGFPAPRPDENSLTAIDLQGAGRAKQFLDAGLPPDGLLETSRIIGMTMAQLAASNRDLIGDVFLEPGVDERELALRYAAAAQAMSPLLGETLRYVHDQHLRESIREAVVSDRELAEGRLEGSDRVAIAFADLVDFTRLGERLEIDAIGRLTGRLFELASDAARPPVRLVKMIGDAAMFASPDPASLLDAVTGLVEADGDEELPSLRAGAALGEALGRGGDWYGRPVNLAARITAFARPDSVIVDNQLKSALADDPRFEFSFAGKHRFKGIKREIPVHRGRRRQAAGKPG
jgi:adenylate cyclase